jgi:hypothetical protein
MPGTAPWPNRLGGRASQPRSHETVLLSSLRAPDYETSQFLPCHLKTVSQPRAIFVTLRWASESGRKFQKCAVRRRVNDEGEVRRRIADRDATPPSRRLAICLTINNGSEMENLSSAEEASCHACKPLRSRPGFPARFRHCRCGRSGEMPSVIRGTSMSNP